MKRGIFISLVLLITLGTFCQNSYYETAESFSSGIKIINGKQDDNFHICQIYDDGKIITLSPYEVKQYGLKDGPEYISKEITISDEVKRVFLERLTRGRTSLYYYLERTKGYFFMEKDSSELFPVPGNEGKEDNSLADFLLMISSDCRAMAETAGSVKHNKLYLTKFINAYNNCDPITFPRVRYGVLLGLSTKKLVPSQNNSDIYLAYFNFKAEPGLAAGVFVSIPVALSDVSLQMELFYNQHRFSGNATAEDIDFEFKGESRALKIPFLFRYSRPSTRFCPYVLAGPVLEYNFRHDFTMYQTPLTGEVVVLPESDYTEYVKDLLKGFSAGGGLEYKIAGKRSIIVELRYDYLANASAGSFINNSSLNLLTGISF